MSGHYDSITNTSLYCTALHYTRWECVHLSWSDSQLHGRKQTKQKVQLLLMRLQMWCNTNVQKWLVSTGRRSNKQVYLFSSLRPCEGNAVNVLYLKHLMTNVKGHCMGKEGECGWRFMPERPTIRKARMQLHTTHYIPWIVSFWPSVYVLPK